MGLEKDRKTKASTPVQGSPAAKARSSPAKQDSAREASSPLPSTFKPFTFSPVGPFGATQSPLVASLSSPSTSGANASPSPASKLTPTKSDSPSVKYEFKFTSALPSSPLALSDTNVPSSSAAKPSTGNKFSSAKDSFEVDRLAHYQGEPRSSASMSQEQISHPFSSATANAPSVRSVVDSSAPSTAFGHASPSSLPPTLDDDLLSGTTTPTAASSGWRNGSNVSFGTPSGSRPPLTLAQAVLSPVGTPGRVPSRTGSITPSASLLSPGRSSSMSRTGTASHADLLATHTAALNSLHDTFSSLIHARETSASDLEREVSVWKSAYMQAQNELVALRAETELLRVGREEVEANAIAVGKEEGRREEEGKRKRGTFTAVLVDGDSNVFHEDLISDGAAGGRKAAKLLLSSLPGILARHAPTLPASALSQSQAIVNVFVNRNGLGNTLYKANLVPSLSVVNDFWLGFSQSHANISVIDVGQGKEAVDAKIVAQLRLFSGLQQCGLTLLAASGDGGYANILRTLQTESPIDTVASPHTSNRVVLLRGPSFAFALEGICPVAEIDGLFMRDKIMFGMGSGSTPRFGQATPIKSAFGSPYSHALSAKKSSSATPSSTKKALKSMLAAASSGTPGKKASSTPSKSAARVNDISSTSDSAKEPEWTATDTDEVTEGSDVENNVAADREVGRLAAKAAKQLKQAKAAMASERSSAANKKRERVVATTTDESESDESLDDGLGFESDEDEGQGWEDVPEDLVRGMKGLSNKDRDSDSKRRGQGTMDLATLGRVSASGRQRKKSVPGGETAVRKLNPRPCHKDYLNPVSACDNPHCTFGHLYRLSPQQMDYLAKLVKQVPCPLLKIGRCPEEGVEGHCFYGHTCPHGRKCNWGDDCRFRELPGGGHAGM